MNWLLLLAQLLPTIVKMMGIAEAALVNKPKSGTDKKALVMAGTQAVVEGIQAVSTGGQATTWNQIAAPVSAIVDSIATIAFPH